MPHDMPSADYTFEFDELRRLVTDQFPSLGDRPLELLTNGWDNVLVRLGDDLLIRLPRRRVAAHLIEHEQRWLPELASRLPLPIPVPLYAGRPGRNYPWPWNIVAFREGVNATDASYLDTGLAARTLGDFLGRLHLPAPPQAPVNPFRGVPLRARETAFRANLEAVGDAIDPATAQPIWQAAVDAGPWRHEPVWVHGDLHPANLLVADARIAAVLDFGDLTSGDPATDLAIAWLLLPREDRPAFWASYRNNAAHDADSDLEARARGWALALSTIFLAHSADNPMMRRIGSRGLSNVLEE